MFRAFKQLIVLCWNDVMKDFYKKDQQYHYATADVIPIKYRFSCSIVILIVYPQFQIQYKKHVYTQ